MEAVRPDLCQFEWFVNTIAGHRLGTTSAFRQVLY